MALTNEQITQLFDALPNDSYKQYISNRDQMLSTEMASALGTPARKIIKVLNTVIDAIVDKLEIQNIVTNDATIDTVVQQWLSSFDRLQKKIFRAVVRDGKTYVLVSYKNNTPALYQLDVYDGRQGAIIVYSDTDKSVPLYALNTWYAKNDRYVDVYYDNRIEKYINKTDGWEKRTDFKGEVWPIDWTDNNNAPLGLALIEYSIGESDLANGAVQLQKDINEAILDLLATSRNQGWPQRYIENAQQTAFLTNSLGMPLVNTSGLPIARTLKLIPGSTMLLMRDEKLGQLNSAEPKATVLDTLLHVLYLATTVPTHYFIGDWPSGVALMQSESKLNHKVESHQLELSPAIQTTLRRMIQLNNTFGTTVLNTDVATDIQWFSPQILTEDLKMELQRTAAQYVFQLKNAGVMSVETAVRTLHEDWTEDMIQAEVARIQGENAIA